MNVIAKKALCVALAAYLTAGSAAALNAGNVSNMTVPFAVKAEAADAANSGSCGENLTWSLDSDGLLTISGTGDMTDYHYWDDSYAPWKGASVKSVVISDGVTSIGSYAFYGCTGLTSVTIPDGVTSIGERAFYRCTGLTSITIPDGVTSIEWGAFSGCTGLTSITIPDSVTYIDYNAFHDTAFYNDKSNWENGVLYICNHLIKFSEEFSGECNIKPGTKVIAFGAFAGCTGLTSVTIPDSVTSIGSDAFSGCTGLTSITIPDSVTSIGGYAFYRCAGLTSVTIPDSVTSIGYSAFSGCTGLTSVTIPYSVTWIGDSAFAGCTGLMSISLPKGIQDIGANAFSGCTGLTSIIIPSMMISIRNGVFSGCTSLTSIIIPGSVKSIADDAFSGCAETLTIVGKEGSYAQTYAANNEINFMIDDRTYNITYTLDDNGLLTISGTGKMEDYYEDNLAPWSSADVKSVVISDGITSIGDLAFYGCTGLTSVTIPDSVTSIGIGAFYNCTGLTSVTISDGVKNIGVYAFAGCTGLTSVTIPDSVMSIGADAFYGVANIVYHGNANAALWGARILNGYIEDGLVYEDSTKTTLLACFASKQGEVVIPDSVTSIGNKAFFGCSGIVGVTIPAGVRYISSFAFDGCSETLIISGKAGSYAQRYARDKGINFNVIANEDSAEPTTKPSTDDSDESTTKAECNHICHKKGIAAFFYKIARLFWKIFGINKVYDCGVEHY